MIRDMEKALADSNAKCNSLNAALDVSMMSGFADDSVLEISNISNEVFDLSKDMSKDLIDEITSRPTRSVTDATDRPVFVFRNENEDMKRAYNLSGKRFERGSGLKNIRNNIVNLSPVSSICSN